MPASDSIKNIPSLNDYYRKLLFGFAAGRVNLSPAMIEDCTDRRNFSAAELSYEYCASLTPAAVRKLKKRFPEIHCGNFFTPGQTSLILGAGRNIRNDFIRTCRRMIRDLASAGIRCCSLDFSLTNILRDDDRLAVVSEILRKLHPALFETGMSLLLPVRLPLPDPEIIAGISAFLRERMITNLKLRLEIWPHVLKPDFKPEVLAGTLRLETGSVVFCCNADAGNRLIRAHLTPWLRYFALNGFHGPILFAPFSQNNRLAVNESDAFSKLTEEICKNR